MGKIICKLTKNIFKKNQKNSYFLNKKVDLESTMGGDSPPIYN